MVIWGVEKELIGPFWLRERCVGKSETGNHHSSCLPRETAAGKGPHPRAGEASGLGSRGEGSPARAANAREMQSMAAGEPASGAQTGRRPGEGMSDGFSGQWEP